MNHKFYYYYIIIIIYNFHIRVNFSSLISVNFCLNLQLQYVVMLTRKIILQVSPLVCAEDRRKAHANMVIRNIVLRDLGYTVS